MPGELVGRLKLPKCIIPWWCVCSAWCFSNSDVCWWCHLCLEQWGKCCSRGGRGSGNAQSVKLGVSRPCWDALRELQIPGQTTLGDLGLMSTIWVVPGGFVQVPGCGTRVWGWLMFACPLCSQQSQGTPLISVSSVTAGGSAGKAGKRPTPNALEDDRGEKFEKSGEALEMGNASGNMEDLASGIFLNFCTAHRIPACGVPWGLLTPWSSPSSPRMEPHAGLGWKGP